jgi:nitrogenase subunit NifH
MTAALRSDASLDLKVEEAGEEVVDGSGGLEVGEAGGEFGGVGLLGRGLAKATMVWAEVGRGISEHAAAAVAGTALAAAV